MLRVAALLLALLVAGVLVHLFLSSAQETTEEKIRGPAVVKGCDVRGSRVVVTAEVFNDRDYAINLSTMIFWATDASGTSVTKAGATLPLVRLEPGQRMTRTGTAELIEGVDQARVTGCKVSVR